MISSSNEEGVRKENDKTSFPIPVYLKIVIISV